MQWIEATIAFGEVLVDGAAASTSGDASRLEAALRCFITAREFTDEKKNPTTAAACSFHIARTYSLLGDHWGASDAYAAGLRAAEFVEYGFVKRLAADTAAAIGKANTLFIASDLQLVVGGSDRARGHSATEISRRLEAFLAHRAVALAPNRNREAAAARLGIDVRTLRRWYNRLRPSPRR
jgi:hypothetical protein